MGDRFVGGHIRRSNRNLLMVNGFLLLAVLAYVGARHQFLWEHVTEGVKTDVAKLAIATQSDWSHILEVDVQEVEPTGYQIVEGSGSSEKVKYEFLAATAGEKTLIVKVPANRRGTHFTGTLSTMPYDLRMALARDLEPAVMKTIVPVMLDTTEYKGEVFMAFLVGIPVALLAAWNVWRWKQRQGDPTTHPIMKQLAHRGAHMAVQQIDNEVAAGAETVGKVVLTNSWVLMPYFFGLHALHLDELAWIYKKVTKHSVNFIPTGKTYSAVLCGSSGKTIEANAKEAVVDDLTTRLSLRAPWAIAGFSDDIQNLWTKNRDALLQEVNQRRSAAKKSPAPTAGVAVPAMT